MEVRRCGPRGQGRMCNCFRRPRGPPSRSVVKKLLRVGGCLHRIVGCGEVRAAIRVGVRASGGCRGLGVGGANLADRCECGDVVGAVRRRRGHFYAARGLRRRRGPESCPRARRMSPAGTTCTRPRGMSPAAGGRRSTGIGRRGAASAGGDGVGGAGRWEVVQAAARPGAPTQGSPAPGIGWGPAVLAAVEPICLQS